MDEFLNNGIAVIEIKWKIDKIIMKIDVSPINGL